MKNIKFFALFLSIISLCGALTGCNENKFELDMYYTRFSQFTDFNEEGYWTECYETSSDAGAIIDNVWFSHSAQNSEYDGVTYYSWNGFCPSEVHDTSDYSSEGTWMDHQWGAMESTQWAAGHKTYVIGDWDVRENPRPSTLSGTESCVMALADGRAFMPLTISISNSSYAYYTMINGSAFSKPFDATDYLTLIITGFLDGQKTGVTEVNLAKDNVYLTNFTEIDIANCGAEVDRLVFTFKGSDSGQWGLNTPAYFAIGAFTYAINR